MTCRQAQKRLVEHYGTAAPGVAEPEIRAHLEACGQCAREFAEIQAALALIEPPVRVPASPDFKERVMNELTKSAAPASRWRILAPRVAVAGLAVALLILLVPMIGSLTGTRGQTSPVSLLAQSVQALSGLQSVHILARMRTRPAENFSYINTSCDWVPLEMWKQFGNPPRWRVEKAGRVAVMDGTSSTLLIRPIRTAARGGKQPGFIDWLGTLLDTDRVMESELQAVKAGTASASLSEGVRNGARETVLTVNRKAQGDLSNDWLRNKTVHDSDQTRTYRFDAASKRLVGMQLVVHSAAGDAAVFEVTEVRYNESLAPAVFALDLPPDVTWYVEPQHLPTANRPLPNSPKEAAVMLFDALSRADWEQAAVVLPFGLPPEFKQEFGGLQVVSIGEPFRSGSYGGWFVPYEIRLKSGEVKKFALAVRNDNPARRWVKDGGL